MQLLARVLLSLVFLVSGLNRLMNWSYLTGYAASHGFPGMPVLLAALIVIETAGGLSLLLGFRARAGAAILFTYLGITTLFFHAFWLTNGPDRAFQLTNFLRNFAIMGGLLEFVIHGAGKPGMDAERAKPAEAPTTETEKGPPETRKVA